MTESRPSDPGETSDTPAHTITIAAIDAVRAEHQADPSQFLTDEDAELTVGLMRLKEWAARQMSANLPADLRNTRQFQVRTGFLFTHRLVRRSVPDFRPPAESYAELQAAVKYEPTEQVTLGSGPESLTVVHFPEVGAAFHATPEAYLHLNRSFGNDYSRYGSQVVLLALSDQIFRSQGA